jgi:hypothetical protein
MVGRERDNAADATIHQGSRFSGFTKSKLGIEIHEFRLNCLRPFLLAFFAGAPEDSVQKKSQGIDSDSERNSPEKKRKNMIKSAK